MNREQIRLMFERRKNAWNQHDAAVLTADYTEDCILASPYVGRITGRAAMEDVFESFFAAFRDLEYHDETLVVENDQKIAQFFSIAGTHLGEFMGMPATGRRFECHISALLTIRGDQICFERRVYDFTGLLVQVGVLKAKPA